MTEKQWDLLCRVIAGEPQNSIPVGLIIDSPWLPKWAGMTILDYFEDPAKWLAANLRAVREFPDVIFLPGFWSEYGMCSEPAAFGAKCIWYEDAFPSVERTIHEMADVQRLTKPNCETDGLQPFLIKRLQSARKEIEASGHAIRMAVARGPLNIASYLTGHTEFLMGIKISPNETHQLLKIVTEFLCDWVRLQVKTFDTIDGVLLLDDLIGFLSPNDFEEFGLPYLKEIYDSVDVTVKALHNDAHGLVTAKYLPKMGVNLFNFSHNHSYEEIASRAGNEVTLLGNIPPRDVFAAGSPSDVKQSVASAIASIPSDCRVIMSCGGGTPPDVTSENIEALCQATNQKKSTLKGPSYLSKNIVPEDV